MGLISESIRLWIPALPDPDLSSNRRRTRAWQAQARDTATERERAFVMLREALQQWADDEGRLDWFHFTDGGHRLEFPWPVELHWTLHFPTGRAWDWDACVAALKAWQDAMTPPIFVVTKRGERSAPGLGWLPGDGPKYVVRGSTMVVPSSPKGPGMELEIRSVDATP